MIKEIGGEPGGHSDAKSVFEKENISNKRVREQELRLPKCEEVTCLL